MNAHPSSLSDRELLLLAAKAAGIVLMNDEKTEQPWHDDFLGVFSIDEDDYWNPLDEDGQALRLANDLEICIEFGYCLDDAPIVSCGRQWERESWQQTGNFPDPYAATRRAIVVAAAAIAQQE